MSVEIPMAGMEFLRRTPARAVRARPGAGESRLPGALDGVLLLSTVLVLTLRFAPHGAPWTGPLLAGEPLAGAPRTAGALLAVGVLVTGGALLVAGLILPGSWGVKDPAARRGWGIPVVAGRALSRLGTAAMPLSAVTLGVLALAPTLGREAGPAAGAGVAPWVPGVPAWIPAAGFLAAVLVARCARAATREAAGVESRRQAVHARAMVEVTHALADANDLGETLQVIARTARSVLGGAGAGIELIVDEGHTLETVAAVGIPSEAVGLRFPVAGSFTGWVVRHHKPRSTSRAARDPHVQPQSLAFLDGHAVAAAPIRFRGRTTGALYVCRRRSFHADESRLLGALAEQAAIAIERARLFERISELSATDPLTGVANRRSLTASLEREFAAAQRGRTLAAVIFDLDDFKVYNDRNGHLAGDEALKAFARSLEQETRTMNVVGRYGGDEFVALLSDTDLNGAAVFVERVRIRFASAMGALGMGGIGVSAGMAAYHPTMSGPESLLRAADNALYRQKPRVRV